MQRYNILWADDEIDLLKPHIIFLEAKGYDVTPVHSGTDALEKIEQEEYDVVFLDENMPGISGLETLHQIKSTKPGLPVIMITKSEEEHIMEEAIGAKIADYLIKPLNPNQILLSVKKILENKKLITKKTNTGYQQDFRHIAMAYNERIGHEEWADIYKKLIYWELEIDNTENKSMKEIIDMQKNEANTNFSKFILEEYEDWLNSSGDDKPILSNTLLKTKVFPLLKDKEKVFLFVIDNLRYDQWKIIEPLLAPYFSVTEESSYFSILPTTTNFARNSIFSGLMPSEMEKKHPDLWVNDDEEDGKNNSEEQFLAAQLSRNGLGAVKMHYQKITNANAGKQMADTIQNLYNNDLNVVVYNFVDMLSHARTDTEMIRELAPDESAYRSITYSWFQHSPLLDAIKKIVGKGFKIVITTDHGTIRVKKPTKIIGDKNTNTNLRYKHGKNLAFDEGHLLVARKPERFFLPKRNVSTAYVFTTEDYFFAYPNNYNYYVNYYKDTFQHGGISLEEMIVPFVILKSK